MDDARNQRIVLAAVPDGELRPSDLRLEDAPTPVPAEGELLLETVYLSIDPYMRAWMRQERSYNRPIGVGEVIVGGTVSRVRASRHPDWQMGEWVVAHSGWRRFALSDGTGLRRIDSTLAPVSTALGVLGMPGFTAYAGLRNIGQPKPGETVVVAAASGAVGSMVGQLARLGGARAVGITSGADKLAYVRDELGFDAAVDHRAPDLAAQLAAACPNGIDVYFELVGGPVWDAVLPLLNPFARVPVCGVITQYENPVPDPVANRPAPVAQAALGTILSRSLTLRGFIQTEYADAQFPDFLAEAAPLLASGRLRHREHIVQGLEQAPEALTAVLKGRKLGKMLVEVGTP